MSLSWLEISFDDSENQMAKVATSDLLQKNQYYI
jgi:hypothetical protein